MMRRGMLLLLGVVILVSAVYGVGFAAAAEQENTDQMYYVFVIDASIKGEKGTVCAAVCDTVRNALSEEDARIGVIAYGYDGDDEDLYAYSSVDRPDRETEYVHQILELGQVDSTEAQMLHERLLGAFSADEQTSPHGQGLLAGVDMLRTAGVPREQGCVIWITDGIRASEEWNTERDARNLAVDLASENQWPIYTIHTDYGEEDERNQTEALRMMTAISEKSAVPDGGAPAYQRIDMCDAMEENAGEERIILSLHENLLKILPGEKWREDPRNGVVRTENPVENLTSEYTVAFIGAGVTEVSVEFPHADTKVYRESVVDGDVKVQRVPYGFVVTLNNPDPEMWVVNGHGNSEMLVYRNKRFHVDISLRLEIGNGVEYVSGDEETLNLAHDEKIRFVPTYMHRGSELNINEGAGNIKEYLVIQSRKPGKAHQYRNLMKIGEDSEPMQWLTTDELGTLEYQAYGERSGIYQARIELVWEGENGQKVVSEWFPFGHENLPPVVCGEPLPTVAIQANGQSPIGLSEYIQKEPVDCWMIELMPNEDFVFLNEKGEVLEAACIETYGDTIYVQAPDKVGDYKLVLQVTEAGEEYEVEVPVKVESYPEYNGIVDEDLYLESDVIYSCLDFLGFSMGNAVCKKDLGPGVTNVDLVGDGADQITVSCTDGMLILHPDASGEYDLQLKVERDAQVKDENGVYGKQVDDIPVRLKVVSPTEELTGVLPVLVALAVPLIVIAFLCLPVIQKLPKDMQCTMEIVEGNCTKDCIKRDMMPKKPKSEGFFKGAWSRFCGITLEQFIHDFVNYDKMGSLKIKSDKEKLGEMRNWIMAREGLLRQDRLGHLKFKGVISKKYAYRITGNIVSNPALKFSFRKLEGEQAEVFPGTTIINPNSGDPNWKIHTNNLRIPVGMIATITLDLSHIDQEGSTEEKKDPAIIIMTIQRKQKK